MPDIRALDEPLSDAELDELEAFLASDAVPPDCMDLEMLDGYLAAIASGPESIQPSEWLPGVWSEGGKSTTPAYGSSDQAQRIMGLMLRHMVGIERTLAESPTRFRPLLYLPEAEKGRGERPERGERGERAGESERGGDAERGREPPEGTAWCEGYMAGEWDTPDLSALLEVLASNFARFEKVAFGNQLMAMVNLIHHALRRNSRSGSRKNIQAHYDLGNAF